MKRFVALLFVISACVVHSQDAEKKDDILRQHFVGSWTHIRSVYPNDSIAEYFQEFDIYEDGTGVCHLVSNGVTITVSIIWRIKDGKSYLYTVFPDGRIIHGDTIFFSHIDKEQFFGDRVFGPDELRKTCFYKRKVKDVG